MMIVSSYSSLLVSYILALLLHIHLFAYASDKILKIGGIFNPVDSNGNPDSDQAQSLAAFLLAIDEINSDSTILPNEVLKVAIRSAYDFKSGVDTAHDLMESVSFSLGGTYGNSDFFSNTAIGVDAVIGAGNDDVTMATNEYFTTSNTTQIHTVSTIADLGDGLTYPYKLQTVSIDSYVGMVWQNIMCYTFNYTHITVFATDDELGVKAAMESIDGAYCNITVLSRHFITWNEIDFTSYIDAAKYAGAYVFVLLMSDPSTAGRLLRQGYYQGLFREGTQILCHESLLSQALFDAIGDTVDNIKRILKGILFVQYQPAYSLRFPVGQAFVQSYQSLPYTNGILSTCNTAVDDTDDMIYLYRSQTDSTLCTGLDHSTITADNMSPNAPHAYDATWALARGLHRTIYYHGLTSIDGDMLRESLILDGAFQGVTGLVEFFIGMPDFGWYGAGNREVGHTYFLYNFNDANYDRYLQAVAASSSPPITDAFAWVGKFTAENSVTWCSDIVDGGVLPVCQSMTYNSPDNKAVSDIPPYQDDFPPKIIKFGGFFNTINEYGVVDIEQTHSLSAFLMAIDEINADTNLLPGVQVVSAIRDGFNYNGASEAAIKFATSCFGNTACDVVIGAGDDIETEISNEMFSETNICQIHAVATSPELGDGSRFPYKMQTVPIDSYQGMLWQSVMCDTFGFRRLSVFATDDTFGTKSAMESVDNTYCNLTVLSTHFFKYSETDFSSYIDIAKLAGSRVFVLLISDPSTAGRLLRQGYYQGLFREGTQILCHESLLSQALFDAIGDTADNVKRILKGTMFAQYQKAYSLRFPKGQGFVKRFLSQNNTVTYDSVSHRTVCSMNTDDSAEYFLYHSQTNKSLCTGIDYSMLTESDISATAPHVYDATYAAAHAIHQMLPDIIQNGYIDNDALKVQLRENISFVGVTGLVEFFIGMPDFGWYGAGNREVGHTYFIYNFNDANYDRYLQAVAASSSPPITDAFAWVGKFTAGSYMSWCSDIVDGGVLPVCQSMTYNTADNMPAMDHFPDIHASIVSKPPVVALVYSIGSITILMVLLIAAGIVYYRDNKLVKASQPVMQMFILLGCVTGGIRVYTEALTLTNMVCSSQLWLGHLAFNFAFGALTIKTYRIHKLLNNSGFKRVKFSTLKVMLMQFAFMLFIAVYLAIVDGVGKPHAVVTSVYSNNQTTYAPKCSYVHIELLESLYAFEAILLVIAFRLTWAIRDIPDALNESKSIASTMAFLCFIMLFSFPIIYLIGLPYYVQQIIAAFAFAFASIGTVCFLFVPKLIKIRYGENSDKSAPALKSSNTRSNTSKVYATDSGSGTGGSKGIGQLAIIDSVKDLKGTFDEKNRLCREQLELWRIAIVKIGEESDSDSTHRTDSKDNVTTTLANEVVSFRQSQKSQSIKEEEDEAPIDNATVTATAAGGDLA